jgi:peptidoglycan/xylan/chitin deacetylase (PgdA/CDA1 family)
MFFDADIKGNGLPARSVCLTYDDGPGPETEALGEYLFEERIQATFFVLGRHAEGNARLLRKLQQWGHLIGNHTYSHPGLVAYVKAGGDPVVELARTDTLIRPYVTGDFTFFRAPYGNWRTKNADNPATEEKRSLVAEALNRSGRFPNYIGPINWDISAADYDFWRDGRSGRECAQAYLHKTESIGRGIILMHDHSEDRLPRSRNRAYKATKWLVPALKSRGYLFVSLDAVPQVREACRMAARSEH